MISHYFMSFNISLVFYAWNVISFVVETTVWKRRISKNGTYNIIFYLFEKYQILSFSEIPNTLLLRNTKYSPQKYQILSSEIPNTLFLRNTKYSPSEKYQILSSEISNTLLLRNTKYSPQKYQIFSFSEIPNTLLLRNTKYSPSLNLNNVDAIMTFLAKLTLEWLN